MSKDNIDNIKRIFALPVLVPYALLSSLFPNLIKKDYSNTDHLPVVFYIFSTMAWLFLINWIYNYNSYNKIYYVYACKNDYPSNCYKVKADYIPSDCDDERSSTCTDSSINAIYFIDGKKLEMDYCVKEDKDKWSCYALGSNDNWNLQIAEAIKVKKK